MGGAKVAGEPDSLTVYFTRPRRIAVRREPAGRPEPGQALVETALSGISGGTELLLYRGLAPQHLPADETIASLSGSLQFPFRHGYACVGRVTHVGSPDDGTWIGSRVFAFHPHASRFVAALADLLPIPETVSNDQAVFFPNLETAVSLVQDGAPILGERVAIFGQGVVGLLTAMLLARHPGLTVVSVDPLPRRRQLSLRLGAYASLDPQAPRFPEELATALGGGQADGAADLAYEMSGSAAALNAAIRATGFQARIVVGAWYGSRPAEIDLGGEFHRRRLRLISSQVSRIDPALSARWTKARRYDLTWRLLEQLHPDEWITHRIPIAQAGRAYQQLDRRADETLQVVLTYS